MGIMMLEPKFKINDELIYASKHDFNVVVGKIKVQAICVYKDRIEYMTYDDDFFNECQLFKDYDDLANYIYDILNN